MKKVIEAAVKYNVVIEINSRYNIPSAGFIKMAKVLASNFHLVQIIMTRI